MKKLIISLTGLLVSTVLVACGGSDNSSGAANPSYGCPNGSTFQNGYCVGATGNIYPTGSIGYYSENYAAKNLQVASGMNSFLADAMGVCDRAHSNGGLSSCSAWSAGAFDVVMQVPSAQATSTLVTFRAKPSVNPAYNYSYSLPSAGQLAGAFLGFPVPANPQAYLPILKLNMVISVTNNYQGFEARGYGDAASAANRSLIQIQVPQGKLEDSYFSYRIVYSGQAIATGQFVRCSSADCRVNQPLPY